MRSINTKFIVLVLALAAAFSGAIFLQTWLSSRARVKRLTAREANLALEFDLAIRSYIAESVRPVVEARVGQEEFIPEAMSTSFVARSVFDKVRKRFPDYVLKFSSDNPMNPANRAGPEEMKILEYFRRNPEITRWEGPIRFDGQEYLGHFAARRMEKECLRCHGRPEDAPKALLERYDREGGFYHSVGEVIAMDTVAIPMEKVNAALAREMAVALGTSAVWLLLLLASVFIVFRYVVTRRLGVITEHFRQAAGRKEERPLTQIAVTGRDEIGVLTSSFNALAARQHALYATLEQRVAERTGQLEAEVAQHQRTEAALRQSEKQYRGIFEAVPDSLLVYDRDGTVLEANPAACQTYGYGHDELVGLAGKGLVRPDYHWAFEDFKRRLRAGRDFHIESVDVHHDGSTFDVEVWGTTFDYKGTPCLLAVVRNITAHKRAEEALVKSEERFSLAMQGARTMHQLLSEVLELSRIGRVVNPPEDAPLGDLAREAVELVSGKIFEASIQVRIDPDLPVLYGGVESEGVGRGAKFCFTIPSTKTPAATPE